ncbi:hypothetical protein [Streptomyces malaysiense]|uniref:hypothetical protein n=1 Tax=Streptomyces malaysiense TaxID=1428626 RepID=UPI000AFB2B6E|nr:hypothetical protein [Streptomyces malaysiense]
MVRDEDHHAPNDTALGPKRVNATCLLHDSRTLTPTAFLDRIALTTPHTPAVSVAG